MVVESFKFVKKERQVPRVEVNTTKGHEVHVLFNAAEEGGLKSNVTPASIVMISRNSILSQRDSQAILQHLVENKRSMPNLPSNFAHSLKLALEKGQLKKAA
jgi:hypothetical protein